MGKELIPANEFQTAVPSSDGLLTVQSTNTESPSNNDLLSVYDLEVLRVPLTTFDYQALPPDSPLITVETPVTEIPPLLYTQGTCFNNMQSAALITTLEELYIYLCDVLIRFDAAPNHYQKEDYEALNRTLVGALIYLYNQDGKYKSSLSAAPFLGLATLTTDPLGYALTNNYAFPGVYFAPVAGVYTNFGITVDPADLAMSVVMLIPNIANEAFVDYRKEIYAIDTSTLEIEKILTSDIPVVLGGGKTLGKYLNGQTIPAIGKTLEEVVRDIALEYVMPVFTSFSVSGQATTVEVGTTLSGSKTFTWGITLNSGTVSTIDLYDNTAGSTLLLNTANDGTQAQTITTIQLNADGSTQSWKGIAHDTGSSPSNINSSNFVVTSRYTRFWGAASTLITTPSDGAGNRTYALALPSNAVKTPGSNTFTLVTGTTLNKFVVLLPPGITITSVTDTTNLNANLTSNYVLIGTVQLNDAGGTARSYNRYECVVGVPYSLTANHVIVTN